MVLVVDSEMFVREKCRRSNLLMFNLDGIRMRNVRMMFDHESVCRRRMVTLLEIEQSCAIELAREARVAADEAAVASAHNLDNAAQLAEHAADMARQAADAQASYLAARAHANARVPSIPVTARAAAARGDDDDNDE